MLSHVADGRGGPVPVTALQNAIDCAAFLETHAARVYGSESSSSTDAAATLLRKLQQPRNPLPTYFTARQVYRKGWALLNRPEEAEAACEVLVDHHWLMATYVPTTERGGRPTYLYHLNPLANP